MPSNGKENSISHPFKKLPYGTPLPLMPNGNGFKAQSYAVSSPNGARLDTIRPTIRP
ncbi:hypothetical protein [Hallella colorans]|uniref:hypothetical protein n=1 Tax=Hallella colorans TaxID=1703337 RepID=UPI0014036BBF|nr:hypothetical protein [Hallella colorans]